MKKAISWIGGPLLAVLLLWLVFRDTSWADLSSQVRRASVPGLVGAGALGVVHLLLRSFRWRTLLSAARGPISFRERFSAVSIGYMASLLPGRVGEVLRPLLLSRRTDVAFGTALATVGVERIVLDLMAVLLLGGLGLVLPSSWTGLGIGEESEALIALRSSGGVVLVALLLALGILVIVARRRTWVEGVVERVAGTSANRVMRAVGRAVSSLLPGLDAFKSPASLVSLLLQTALIWGVIAYSVQLGIESSGVDLPPAACLLILPLIAAAIALPTPGGAGTYHGVMLWGLVGLFGADKTAAASAAVLTHLVTWIPPLAIGGTFALTGGLARHDLGIETPPVEAER